MNLIVLFRGTDCSRTTTVFPIWCRSKPRVEATKQLAIRLSALSIRLLGVYTVARKDSDREKYIRTYIHISFAPGLCIQMRRNDHGIQVDCITLLSKTGGIAMCISHGPEEALRIYRSHRCGERFDSPEICFSYLSSSRILSSRCYFFHENNDIGLTRIVNVCLGVFS